MTITDKTFKKLESIVGKQFCSREKEDLLCYAYDATARSYLPSAVLFPQDAREISAILYLANSDRFFVTPRGAGTGMTGGSLPVEGGIVLAMSRLNRILEIDKDNLIAHAEPGVVTGHFH
ncbi:MAG: FAD-binding oxidoreductase, partial [Desulfobacteraceae bacterium]|nr:FAD-binding oxidoreductase [Desulfobacteraceae bacterium]